MKLLSAVGLVVVGMLSVVRTAAAGQEAPSYDLRANGMGGGGVTSSHGAVALTTNPALVVDGASDVVANVWLLSTSTSAPVLGPSRSADSTVTTPTGFVGGSLLASPRLALALGVSTAGGGAKYDIPGGLELGLTAVIVTIDVGVSYQLTDRLSVGASYRPTYFHESLTTPSPTATNPTAETRFALSRFAPLAASLGVSYQVDDDTTAGFCYRSRVSSDLTGTARTAAGTVDARSHYALPDKLVLGVDRRFYDRRILVALQGELTLFGALDGSVPTTLELPTGPVTQTSVVEDKSTWGVKVGGEGWIVPDRFAVRAGVWLGSEQGRKEHANYFSPYYGMQYLPAAGVGLRFGKLDVNASFTVQLKNSATVAQTNNGNPGTYAHWFYYPGVGATYRF